MCLIMTPENKINSAYNIVGQEVPITGGKNPVPRHQNFHRMGGGGQPNHAIAARRGDGDTS